MLVKGLRFARKVATTGKLGTYVSSPVHPRIEDCETKDDEALNEYVRAQLETAHHPIGTASMLPLEDGGSL